jgi:hypothetical protein
MKTTTGLPTIAGMLAKLVKPTTASRVAYNIMDTVNIRDKSCSSRETSNI